MNKLLAAAAALSFFTWAVHTFLGGRTTAKPLLEAQDLEPVAKYTNYYAWHIVTIVLLVIAGGFAMASVREQSRELAILMTGLCAAFTIWSVVLIAWKHRKPLELPQWTLFLPLTVLGALGLWL